LVSPQTPSFLLLRRLFCFSYQGYIHKIRAYNHPLASMSNQIRYTSVRTHEKQSDMESDAISFSTEGRLKESTEIPPLVLHFYFYYQKIDLFRATASSLLQFKTNHLRKTTFYVSYPQTNCYLLSWSWVCLGSSRIQHLCRWKISVSLPFNWLRDIYN
jgi:hypothetical protein